MIKHSGKTIPAFKEKWDPQDKDWLWISWNDVLDSSSIMTSTWVLPDGWTGSNEQVSQIAEDSKGNQYPRSNGIFLVPSQIESEYIISNRVVLTDGREYERSAIIFVENI